MSIKPDHWIIEQAEKGMITPFEREQVRHKNILHFKDSIFGGVVLDYTEEQKIISFGTSSYGYDIRAQDEWKVFTNINTTLLDPKNFNDECFVTVSGKGHVIIPPNSFALAASVEYMKIPRDVLVVCLGKSTLARIGLVVNVTPLEPEWEGQIVLEFSNTTSLPAKVYANEGCAQLLFFQSDQPCTTSYKDRAGKYQGQQGITLPKV
jgi:dCTP deaminase